MTKIHASLKSASEAKDDTSVSKSVPTFMVDPRIVKIIPGFNARPIDVEHVAYFKRLRKEGVDVGFYELKMIDGVPHIIEGHHRHAADMELIAEGFEILRVKAVEFKGDEKAAILRMLATQSGKQYTPLQVGEQYVKLVNQFGMSFKEIAAARGMSDQHVKDAIRLTEQPAELKDMIKAGEIAPATALKLVKKAGASEVIKAVKQAGVLAPNKPLTQKVINTLGNSMLDDSARHRDSCVKHLTAMYESPGFDTQTKHAIRDVLNLAGGKSTRIGAPKRDSDALVKAWLDDTKANPHSGVSLAAHLLSDVIERRPIAADGSPGARAYGHQVWLQDMAAGHEKATLRAAAHWFLAVLNANRSGGDVAPAPSVLGLEEAMRAEMESGGHVRAETLCPEHTTLINYIRGQA